MQEMRRDAARGAENRQKRQIGGFDTERKIRMGVERQLDRPPFLHPRPWNGEMVGKLVERRGWRLRSDQRGESHERQCDHRERPQWSAAALGGVAGQGDRPDPAKNPHDRHHRPGRDVQQADQKADRAEDRIANDKIQSNVVAPAPRQESCAGARQSGGDGKDEWNGHASKQQLDEEETIDENEEKVNSNGDRDDAARGRHQRRRVSNETNCQSSGELPETAFAAASCSASAERSG